MWRIKTFKTSERMYKWIAANKHKIQHEILFVNNGYAVEYKPLRKI
jgi:hypothetical protein